MIRWLRREYLLDANSARNLVDHVQRQLDAVGVISSDETIVVETFPDAVGEMRMVVHSPFGGRVNGAWALALSDALRERVGVAVETQVSDDGILLRFPAAPSDWSPADIVQAMAPAEARRRILAELPHSAVFGAHFRMNAARALLLPRARGGKRTPFWLQRLKAKDLLAVVGRLEDFPIVAETYRDCLRDVLDLGRLDQVLTAIQEGTIRVAPIETVVPSPVAAGLLYNFISVYMYEWDAPKAERQLQSLALRRDLVDDLLTGATSGQTPLKPEALTEVAGRAAHLAPGSAARTADELAVFFMELGDLTTDEALARCAGDGKAWLTQLASQGRIIEIAVPTPIGPAMRWIPVELADQYQATDWGAGPAAETILRRHLRISGPITRLALLVRYAFDEHWLDETLTRLIAAREIVQGYFTQTAPPHDDTNSLSHQSTISPPVEYCDRALFEQLYRRTVALLRREVQPVSLAAYADFLIHWQGVGAAAAGPDALRRIMGQLRGLALPGVAWERDVLPGRLSVYRAGELDALCASGELAWVCAGADERRARVRFFGRGEGGLFLGPAPEPAPRNLSETGRAAYAFLRTEGASFVADLQTGLRLPPAVVRSALAELALAGLVTGDSLAALHAVLSHNPEASAERPPLSALEAELASRLPPRTLVGRPDRDRYHAAKRRVAERLRAELATEDPLGDGGASWAGRWSPVHRAAVMGPPLSGEERANRLAQIALARHGVVTQELLGRIESRAVAGEELPWEWSELYGQLQRMELRGEVRRGYFIAGLSGVQYALPEAVERLRAARTSEDDALTVLNACDPANVYGGELGSGYVPDEARSEIARPVFPGAGPSGGDEAAPVRFARVPSTHCVLWRGRPVLTAEDNGMRLTVAADVETEIIARALTAYLNRPAAPRRLIVEQWNAAPVLGSAGEPLLKALAFSRTPSGMERWGER